MAANRRETTNKRGTTTNELELVDEHGTKIQATKDFKSSSRVATKNEETRKHGGGVHERPKPRKEEIGTFQAI